MYNGFENRRKTSVRESDRSNPTVSCHGATISHKRERERERKGEGEGRGNEEKGDREETMGNVEQNRISNARRRQNVSIFSANAKDSRGKQVGACENN